MTILDQPQNKTDHVRRLCDLCGDIAKRRYSDLMQSRKNFAARVGKHDFKDYCVRCAPKIKMSGELSPTKNVKVRAKMSRNRRRDPNGKLSDGYVNRGYKYVLDKDTQKYILEHRAVMQNTIDRVLTEKEQVHHINGDKLNNLIENLYLCSSCSDHNRVHASLQKAAFELVNAGIIKFDADSGEYYV